MPHQGHDRLRQLALTMSAVRLLPNRLRPVLLRRAGMAIDPQVRILAGATVSGTGRLHVGPATFINHECYFDCADEIVIGSGVAVGPRVQLITSSHEIGARRQRAGTRVAEPIRIADGCWLGAGVIVLPGVTIAAGCVIGAGAVVTHDTEPDSIYTGTPARRVRGIEDADQSPAGADGAAIASDRVANLR